MTQIMYLSDCRLWRKLTRWSK